MMDIKQIRNDEDLDAAIAEVERLMLLNPKRGSPDGDRLEAMADLVAAYEAKHYPIDPDDPVDMTLTPYKGQHAHVRFELNDGIFAGRLAGINDIVTFEAETIEELQEAFHDAVDDYLETCSKIDRKPHSTVSG
ncbi:MAG: hypothetical protein ABF504_04935 [Komagataeibacter saccharivorans]|uniref:hypothetical protein n=1 Tax=Komagataeibacter saccharivorans TaxID=265959 RepID=UPI0039E85E85